MSWRRHVSDDEWLADCCAEARRRLDRLEAGEVAAVDTARLVIGDVEITDTGSALRLRRISTGAVVTIVI